MLDDDYAHVSYAYALVMMMPNACLTPGCYINTLDVEAFHYFYADQKHARS